MKILFLTSGNARSNFTYRALSLAQELQKQGHMTALVCPCADKYNGYKKEKIGQIGGGRIIQPWQLATHNMVANLLPYIFGAFAATLREKPDLIYIYKPTPISIVGLAAKLFRGTQVILDMDDLGSEVMKVEESPRYQQLLVALCERIGLRSSDRIVAASTYLFQKYKTEYPQKPIHLMPNGIDDSWFTPTKATDKEHRIVFMGAVGRKSILEPLFMALPKVAEVYPDTELLLMGDGKYLRYFKEMSRQLGINGRVTFTGWLDPEKARENLRAGDIGYGFMPDDVTTRAASNMKTPQYMIRGVVPFVSRTGDLPMMVDYGKAGYITPSEDIEDIIKTLIYALGDKDRKESKSQSAYRFAAANFSWKKLSQDFSKWMIPDTQTKEGMRKKVYMICMNTPANVGGSEIRNMHLLRQLVKEGKDVTLFCISTEEDKKALADLVNDPTFRTISRKPRTNSLPLILRALSINRVQPFMDRYRYSGLGREIVRMAEIERPEVIQLEQLEAYYAIRPYLRRLKRLGIKVILDAHNVEIEAFKGSIANFNPLKRLVGKFLLNPLRKMEIGASQDVDAIFACSEEDAAFFKRYNKSVHIVPNGVDCRFFTPENTKTGNDIIFMGGTKYSPNADAIRFYLSEVHPRVRKAIPDARLLAIGASQQDIGKYAKSDDSVQALGFVEDVKPYLDMAKVGICPVRHGSGTRLKVLTFMAAGLSVVATSKGAEGIRFRDGIDISIADDAEVFADKVISLLADAETQKRIGDAARTLMLENYDWDVIGKKVERAYEEISSD